MSKIKDSQIRNKFYITIIVNAVLLPGLLIFVYDKFAGGLLNGMWGVYEDSAIAPGLLVHFVNPLLLALSYCFTLHYFKLHIKSKLTIIAKISAALLLIVATLITLLGIFWGLFTT